MLLYLAVDYSRSPELRQRLADNPREVLREYLSDDQRAKLPSYGHGDLERVLHDEVDELVRTLHEHRELALVRDPEFWPVPVQPRPQEVSPAVVQAGTTVTLTISGKDFESDVSVDFHAPPHKKATLSGPAVNSKGTQITGPITFAKPGSYTCVVTNNPGSKLKSSNTLALAITVT
jgi:hypothetical protein